ncbi:hypothetical protein [Streptomyces sp. NPDC019890]|uniref:hypothetical protein n=1 Tax=Streptomyces sp. NPDC019890 TaxID=3365064 RepID=UPI00384B0EDE
MPLRIARIFEQLLRLRPAHGHHRATWPTHFAVTPPLLEPAGPASAPDLLRGEDSALVRPYLVAHEQLLRRQHRRVLWFASHGIDLDSRDIHGLGVA